MAWPFIKPATFSLAAAMPGGGRTDGKGTVVLEPLNVQVTLSTREAPIEPYQAYFPFAAGSPGCSAAIASARSSAGRRGS